MSCTEPQLKGLGELEPMIMLQFFLSSYVGGKMETLK